MSTIRNSVFGNLTGKNDFARITLECGKKPIKKLRYKFFPISTHTPDNKSVPELERKEAKKIPKTAQFPKSKVRPSATPAAGQTGEV